MMVPPWNDGARGILRKIASAYLRVLYSPPRIAAGIHRNPVDSGRFREFHGMEILAVLPAIIVISVPRNSGGFRNSHGITKTESTGTESPEFFLILIVIFKSNTNYLIVITVN